MAGRRSPNYPAVSFPEAFEMAKAIYKKAQRHKTDKESLAKMLGYSGLNGKSLRLIGTLTSHGLLAGTKEEIGITAEGETAIVDPESSEARQEALANCAYKPSIYAEVLEHFDYSLPADELVRPFVLKKGFSHNAADSIVRNLHDTIEFLEGETVKAVTSGFKGNGMSQTQSSENRPATGFSGFMPPPQQTASSGDRELFSYDFEPSGSLRLIVSTEVDTEDALEVLQELLEMKQREVARKAKKQSNDKTEPDEQQ